MTSELTATGGLADAAAALEREILQKNNELRQLEGALKNILNIQAQMGMASPGTPGTHATTPKLESLEYRGMKIITAVEALLRERNEALATREIADVLLRRGIMTKSKNFVATVYAVLLNADAVFKRKGDKWDLVKR